MPTCNRCGRAIAWKQSKSSGKWYAASPSSGRPHHLSCADARSLRAYWAEKKERDRDLKRHL